MLCTKPAGPRRRDTGAPTGKEGPREQGLVLWGKGVALSRAGLINCPWGAVEGLGGRLGQIPSKRGLLVDGRVALHRDTTALGAEVVDGDNAHTDNQLGPGRRGPGHCRPGTASGAAHGTLAVCSTENSSPLVTPISASQAHKMHTQAGLDTGVPARSQGVYGGGREVTASKHCISPLPEALSCPVLMSLPTSGLGHSWHSYLWECIYF